MISNFHHTAKHAKPQIANSQYKAGSGKKKPRRFATGHTRPDDKALTLYPLIRDYPDFGNTHLRDLPSRKKGTCCPTDTVIYRFFPLVKQ